jgi:Cys-tRNA(Pro)/Cys-tRNA(Cys) deacylase
MAGRETPATAAARRPGIHHKVLEYEHDDASASYGLEAAERLGLDPARVFTTLLATVDGDRTADALMTDPTESII